MPKLTKCSRCGKGRPQDQFHKSFVTMAGEQRYFKYCKICAAKKARDYYLANQERLRVAGVAKQRARRKQGLDTDTRRRRDLMKKYGLTQEQWQQMYETQGKRCQICRTDFTGKKICVDHCHVTGAVRGLLCVECNHGLGKFGDDADRLLRAAAYLSGTLRATGAP